MTLEDIWGLTPKKRSKVQTVHLGIDRCMICGKTKSQVGTLERAHVLARGKGGKVTVLLCHLHHEQYDLGRMSKRNLSKLGVSPSRYGRYRPPKPSRGRKGSSTSLWDIKPLGL